MQTSEMNMHPMDSSIFMTIITTGLYIVSVIGNIKLFLVGAVTIQGAAGVMAIIAAASTLILNLYRMYNEYKNNKNNKKT